MEKNKNIVPSVLGNINVLLYDNDNITYYHGVTAHFDLLQEYMTYQTISSPYKRHLPLPVRLEATVNEFRCLENIQLDDTTMKRIAKFNKDQEIKRLDKKIQEMQNKIKELDDLLQDKEKRWNKVKDYIKNIYDINLDDDYDDYDDEWD